MSQPAERSAIEEAVQQQRFAISSEIHDSLLPYLFVTKMRLESLQHLLDSELTGIIDEQVDRHQQIHSLIQDSLHSIDTAQRIGRNLLRSLDSDELLEDSWYEFLHSITQQVSLVPAELKVEGDSDELWPTHVRIAVRGVAREAIMNAIRHGQATRIQVAVHPTAATQHQLLVTDNGRGFDPTQRTMGYGSRFMQVRAATIGATLAVHSQVGGPTTVSLTW